ncbi:hypothetical protein [Spirosoma agri]|uniref:YtxH domain-containing protein n=1 Tax=Spirosoma agri TaxID=1987381 RepID=A0A6M0IGB7_9BACT|nr:hypothetical protein [Spirosoma agri]NEU67214.1 hypothetical protein [Spirosoma agri]
MKAKLLSAFALVLMLTVGAYAQDSTAMSKKEMRKMEKAERKARLKEDMKNTGQSIGETATEVGQGAKRKAKVAGEAISNGANKVGDAVTNEVDKVKAKRDSSRAAKRDSL